MRNLVNSFGDFSKTSFEKIIKTIPEDRVNALKKLTSEIATKANDIRTQIVKVVTIFIS